MGHEYLGSEKHSKKNYNSDFGHKPIECHLFYCEVVLVLLIIIKVASI